MITEKAWNRAYILKKMKGKDFSEFDDSCMSTQYLLSQEDEVLPLQLEQLYWLVQDFFEWFSPDSDLFVMAGPTTLCALAFAHLLARFEEISVAVYKEGKYEYYVALPDPRFGIKLLRFREEAK